MNLKRLLPIFIVIFTVAGFFSPGNIYGEVFTVTTTQDGVAGSLRAAIDAACANTEDNLIHLPPGRYVLEGMAQEDANQSGDLDFNTSRGITIVGGGAGVTFIDGNQNDRVLHILSGTVTIYGVTIQNGEPQCINDYNAAYPGDYQVEHGGGIYNNGKLILRNCTVTGNKAKKGCIVYLSPSSIIDGGHGGGIYNNGTLETYNCTISGNESGIGGATGYSQEQSGNGGGIYNSGWAYLYDSTISNNKAADGPQARPGGDGGHGGGIYSTSQIMIRRCTITGNEAGSGGNGLHSHGAGKGGHGGGIYIEGGGLVSYCAIRNNNAGDGSTDDDSSGDGGNGGGIYNKGMLSVEYSELSNNTSGDSPNTFIVGNGGSGAGIYNAESTIILNASTISGNRAGRGGTGTENMGTGGNGGGIFNAGNATTEINDCTITNNVAGFGGDSNSGGNGGGILSSVNGTVSLKNTILAGNFTEAGGQGSDASGNLLSHGYNLIHYTLGATITGDTTGNITGVEPKLRILGHYVGPTKCHELENDSPAIDAGYAFRAVDQRGCERPTDVQGVANVVNGDDIGAVEHDAWQLPYLTFNKDALFFGAAPGIVPESQTLIVTNSGRGQMDWSLFVDKSWVTLTPAAGTGMGEVTVRVDPTGMAAGTYTATIQVYTTTAVNNVQFVSVTMIVYPQSSLEAPFGAFESPLDGSTVRSSIPVTGWVVDDIGVESVQIFLEQSGELVFIGDAVLVEGARPDVEKVYPHYPGVEKAGWGYMMLTNGLPGQGNGTYVIHAIAADKEGNTTNLGQKTIICDNANALKPFGAIDTPKQGGTASGFFYKNNGWAITPQPNTIPTDGSTVEVYIDGLKEGNVVYNLPRGDISSLFPGYNNSEGAGGYFIIDTAAYANGVHVISWTVTDDAGNTDGIGSRFFNIYNDNILRQKASQAQTGSTGSPRLKSRLNTLPAKGALHRGAVTVKRGYNKKEREEKIHPDHNGIIEIKTDELQRVVVELTGSPGSETVTGGVMKVGNQTRKLPIGSTLDCETGTFYWQPGPGFLGNYHLVFTIDTPGGVKEKTVLINIRPGVNQPDLK